MSCATQQGLGASIQWWGREWCGSREHLQGWRNPLAWAGRQFTLAQIVLQASHEPHPLITARERVHIQRLVPAPRFWSDQSDRSLHDASKNRILLVFARKFATWPSLHSWIDEAARILNTGRRKTIKAFLPIAYGKSLCYDLSPAVFDHKRCLAENTSIFTVLSPPLAQVTDRTSSYTKWG